MRTRRLLSIRKSSKFLCIGIVIVFGLILVDIFNVYIKHSQIYDIPDTYSFLNEAIDNKKVPLTATGESYRITTTDICDRNPHLQYVVLVQSSANNFARRITIRNTWGLFAQKYKKSFEVLFLLGEPRSVRRQAIIEEEKVKFGDIIQGRFLDTYHNLTQKIILGLRWVSQHCSKVETVVKLDDDVVLNIFRLSSVLKDIQRHDRKITCIYREIGSSLSHIHRTGKWKTEAFPGLTHYPFVYCTGFAVLMSRDVVLELFEASKRTPFFWVDDVYFSGVLAKAAGNITHVYLKNATDDNKEALSCYYRNSPCTLVAALLDNTESMENVWSLIVQQDMFLADPFVEKEVLQDWLSKSNKLTRFYLEMKALPWITLLCVYSCILYIYTYRRYTACHC